MPRVADIRALEGHVAVTAKLATLGLTSGMTLEDDAYRAAVIATVAAHIEATRGCAGW